MLVEAWSFTHLELLLRNSSMFMFILKLVDVNMKIPEFRRVFWCRSHITLFNKIIQPWIPLPNKCAFLPIRGRGDIGDTLFLLLLFLPSRLLFHILDLDLESSDELDDSSSNSESLVSDVSSLLSSTSSYFRFFDNLELYTLETFLEECRPLTVTILRVILARLRRWKGWDEKTADVMKRT